MLTDCILFDLVSLANTIEFKIVCLLVTQGVKEKNDCDDT